MTEMGMKEEKEMPVEPIKEAKVAKPGFKTTEFWFAAVTALAGFSGEIAQIIPEKWGATLAAVSALGYMFSRTFLKKNDG